MSIDQAAVVDAVGIEDASGDVILTISDHLDWEAETGHILALQDKLNAYLRFIESGELESAYPDAKGRRAVVDVVGRVPLNLAGQEFFANAGRVLQEAGYGLRFRILAG